MLYFLETVSVKDASQGAYLGHLIREATLFPLKGHIGPREDDQLPLVAGILHEGLSLLQEGGHLIPGEDHLLLYAVG